MPKLSLVLSEKFTEEDTQSLRAALGRRLQVSGLVSVRRASSDPPTTIQLLGEVVVWLPLVAAATAFWISCWKEVAKKVVNAGWDELAGRLKSQRVQPLADVVSALVAASERVGGEVSIGVGLNIPDNYFGTAIWANSRDPVEVAKVLSAFIVHAERISAVMQAEMECERGPVGPAIVELQKDGSVVIRWHAASDFKICEKHLP